MKAIVTGGAGFIGSWVSDLLITKGHEVAVIDNLTTGNKENVNPKAKFYEIDILGKKISEIFQIEKPDYVFHLAAQINVRESIRNPSQDATQNIVGTLNVLGQCVKNNVKKVIFSSSSGAYGSEVKIPTSENQIPDPESPYGIAKLSIEKYLNFFKKVHGLDYVALRYGNVYGPRQNSKGEAGVIAIFVNKSLNGEKLTIFGDGEQTRDYVYVKDVAKANLAAINLSGIFNVGTNTETSVNQIVSKINEITNMQCDKEHTSGIKGEIRRSVLDYSKLEKNGWSPKYSFGEGLKETIDYFKDLRPN